jgi:hypothetical protein
MSPAARALVDAAKAASRRAAMRFLTRETGKTERPDTIAADLRRRHQAALRLPPLPDGRHDPLDKVTR